MDVDRIMQIAELRQDLGRQIDQSHATLLAALNDLKFQSMGQFGDINVRLARIDEHTSATNGAIGRHDREIKVISDGLAKHQVECPVQEEVREIREQVASAAAALRAGEEKDEQWRTRISPWVERVLVAVGGVLLYLTLAHGKEMLAALTK